MKKIVRLLNKEHHRQVMELEWIADLLSKKEFKNKHVGNGTDLEDLKQVAFWGICAAVYDWRPDGGKAIHSYAWDRASAYIGHYMRDKSRIIKIPRNIQKIYYNYVDYTSKNPDVELPDILFKLDCTEEQLEESKGVALSTPFQLFSETLNPEIDRLSEMDPSSVKIKALTLIAKFLNDSEMTLCLNYFSGKLKKVQDKELAQRLIQNLEDKLTNEGITEEVLDE